MAPTDRPTAAETEILRVLWDRGPATVREVHGALERGTGYTTVLKLMQIMVEKGLLARDTSARSHVYRPAVGRDVVERNMVGDLVDRVFAGSAGQLVLRALSERPTSAKELQSIRALLDRIEAGAGSESEDGGSRS